MNPELIQSKNKALTNNNSITNTNKKLDKINTDTDKSTKSNTSKKDTYDEALWLTCC
jgi:hypothetical protein